MRCPLWYPQLDTIGWFSAAVHPPCVGCFSCLFRVRQAKDAAWISLRVLYLAGVHKCFFRRGCSVTRGGSRHRGLLPSRPRGSTESARDTERDVTFDAELRTPPYLRLRVEAISQQRCCLEEGCKLVTGFCSLVQMFARAHTRKSARKCSLPHLSKLFILSYPCPLVKDNSRISGGEPSSCTAADSHVDSCYGFPPHTAVFLSVDHFSRLFSTCVLPCGALLCLPFFLKGPEEGIRGGARAGR